MKKRYLAVFSRRHKISIYTPTHKSWLDYDTWSGEKEILSVEKFLSDRIIYPKEIASREALNEALPICRRS